MINDDDEADRIADAVYSVMDSLTDRAIRRVLEETLIEQAIDCEELRDALYNQKAAFVRQAELKATLSHTE